MRNPFIPFKLALLFIPMMSCDLIMSKYNTMPIGGGRDAIMIDMPFAAGYTSLCTQGAWGSYSHSSSVTSYDVDFDTPNDIDDPVYAPIDGVAYVHDDDRDTNFGVHVNIDLGDGTFILLGHLDKVLIEDGEDVVAGQLIAIEGNTGASSGDHLHIGRHAGEAYKDALYSESIDGLIFSMDDGDMSVELTPTTMDCDLYYGERYTSLLPVPMWHPNGALVKTPTHPDVYMLNDGVAIPFDNEAVFWSYNYQFQNVVSISEAELACYGEGDVLEEESKIQAVYDGEDIWLLIGASSDSHRQRLQVRDMGWKSVLKSWGMTVDAVDDLADDELADMVDMYPYRGVAGFRDGSMVTEVSDSAVYVITDSIAMPVESWDTYVFMDYAGIDILEVEDGYVAAIQASVGDCSVDAYCLSRDTVLTCGGPGDATYDMSSVEEDSGTADTGSSIDVEDSGGTGSEDEAADTAETDEDLDSGYLGIRWTVPFDGRADRISLAGEFIDADGYSDGWWERAVVTDADSVFLSFDNAYAGSTFRFSVEYVRGEEVHWSCTAPYPPGTVTGDVMAETDDEHLRVDAVADPTSAGCGLMVKVP